MQASFDPRHPLGNAVQFIAYVRQAVVYNEPYRAETDYERRNQNRGQGKRGLDQFIQTHVPRSPALGSHGKVGEGTGRAWKPDGRESTVRKHSGYRAGA